MDITYRIIKGYKTEILPILGENPSIESLVQTVLDMSNIKYTFTLLDNMEQERRELIHERVTKGLSEDELQVVQEYLSE